MDTEKTETTTPPLAVQRDIQSIITDLSKPVAGRHVSKRQQGGNTLSYIAWYNAERYLDYFAAGWTKEIRDVKEFAGKVVMTVRITIPTCYGDVYREATGYEDLDTKGYGDPFSNAESMALRRAAANFGLGRYLYDKEN